MTVMVKVEVKEKRRGRKEDMEQRRGDSGRGQCRNASCAVRYTMALFITRLDTRGGGTAAAASAGTPAALLGAPWGSS